MRCPFGGPNRRHDRSQTAAPRVEEIPPDMKPEGENSVWIPGYWSWDDDRRDFLWVSGVWRVPPRSIAGCPATGSQFRGRVTNGFPAIGCRPSSRRPPSAPAAAEPRRWAHHRPARTELLLDPGPLAMERDVYVWQPGYWAACRPDWIWVPATYVWCPRGWVYVPGYWDYPLGPKGAGLFTGLLHLAGGCFHPAVCLDVGAFSISLFARPSLRPLLLWRLLRRSLRRVGHSAVVLQFAALWLRPAVHLLPLVSRRALHEAEWDVHLVGWHDYYRAHADAPRRTRWSRSEAFGRARRNRAGPTFGSFTWLATSMRQRGEIPS